MIGSRRPANTSNPREVAYPPHGERCPNRRVTAFDGCGSSGGVPPISLACFPLERCGSGVGDRHNRRSLLTDICRRVDRDRCHLRHRRFQTAKSPCDPGESDVGSPSRTRSPKRDVVASGNEPQVVATVGIGRRVASAGLRRHDGAGHGKPVVGVGDDARTIPSGRRGTAWPSRLDTGSVYENMNASVPSEFSMPTVAWPPAPTLLIPLRYKRSMVPSSHSLISKSAPSARAEVGDVRVLDDERSGCGP